MSSRSGSGRAEIDAAILEMANDPEYQAEAVVMAEEAVAAGWEALQLGEASYRRPSPLSSERGKVPPRQ